jgi:hypothetical protein
MRFAWCIIRLRAPSKFIVRQTLFFFSFLFIEKETTQSCYHTRTLNVKDTLPLHEILWRMYDDSHNRLITKALFSASSVSYEKSITFLERYDFCVQVLPLRAWPAISRFDQLYLTGPNNTRTPLKFILADFLLSVYQELREKLRKKRNLDFLTCRSLALLFTFESLKTRKKIVFVVKRIKIWRFFSWMIMIHRQS